MIDTNHAYGRSEALTLGKNLQSYKLRWYEEPVVREDIKGYAELRSKLDIPIAGGENEHTLFGFKSLFENNAIDIAQPDIGQTILLICTWIAVIFVSGVNIFYLSLISIFATT